MLSQSGGKGSETMSKMKLCNCVGVWILCSVLRFKKQDDILRFALWEGHSTWKRNRRKRPGQQLSFRVFTWSKFLPMPPGWGEGGRNRKECVDFNYILEVELLGKVHHDRVVKKKTKQLLCILAPVLPYLHGTWNWWFEWGNVILLKVFLQCPTGHFIFNVLKAYFLWGHSEAGCKTKLQRELGLLPEQTFSYVRSDC